MKNLTFANIAAACGGKLCNASADENREVDGVVLDSRKVKANYLFIATRGERADGHDFILQVMEMGAAGAVCEKAPEGMTGPYILVEDSFQALKDIAGYYREQLSIKVIGITGSVGKTSTKEFIASVLSVKYDVLKTEGNYNNEVGLPLTVLNIRENHKAAVLEMGISDFGEMHRLSRTAQPDICVLTNIGQCHLENLKSREGILKAKTEIFDFMKEEGAVCINGDDDMLDTIEEVHGREPLRFGLDRKNRVFADGITDRGLFGSSAVIHIDDMEFEVDIPLPGGHMVYNALAAACVGSLLKLTCEEIKKGIGEVKPLGGRSHIMRLTDKTVIDDCYNANPVSMRAAVDLLSTAFTRKVAILGDMFELGDNTEKLHEDTGAYAALKGLDVIICIGELAKHMYQGALQVIKEKSSTVKNVFYYRTKDEFWNQMDEILKKDDTILVKASHGMAFEEIVSRLTDSIQEQTSPAAGS